ncbi:MAG: hypothetical protein AAFO07_29910 [Bacteroidota bacterium]
MLTKQLNFTTLLFLLCINGFSQQVIRFNNPSFEDIAGLDVLPYGWKDCSFPKSSNPDVLPDPKNDIKPNIRPHHQKNFIGLIASEGDNWDAIGQVLERPIQKDRKYVFTTYLALPDQYNVFSKYWGRPYDYAQPIKLRIWLGDDQLNRLELLLTSRLINHKNWVNYEFIFTPKQSGTSIIIETHFDKSSVKDGFYGGCVLIDNCSAITALPPYETQPPTHESALFYDLLDNPNISNETLKRALDYIDLEDPNLHSSLIKSIRYVKDYEWLSITGKLHDHLSSLSDRAFNNEMDLLKQIKAKECMKVIRKFKDAKSDVKINELKSQLLMAIQIDRVNFRIDRYIFDNKPIISQAIKKYLQQKN